MAQISVNHLTFYYDGGFQNIFEDASFSIDTDWKLGFIGRNGKGKTTFLKLLMGEMEYKGSISSPMEFAYFPYIVSRENQSKSAAEFMEEIKPDYELWKVICELDQLEAGAEILYRSFETLSHGERTKVMLALLFASEDHFLLIDEPTNHLDYEAREVVKQYLAGKKGFILVSHDRDFIDACVDHVLVLNRCTIEVQSGNFSSWWENKSRADSFAQEENAKHKKEIGKLKAAAARTQRWAEKSERSKIGFDPIKEHERNIATRSYIGAKTKKIQSRVKSMENRMEQEIREKEGLLRDIESISELKIESLCHHKECLCRIQKYSLKYEDSSQSLFENLSMEIHQGERILVTGQNGCGKSTLLKSILKHSNPNNAETLSIYENGLLETASGLIISYVNQDTSFLQGNLSDFCFNRELDKSRFLTILRQLDFERSQFDKDIKEYSEGQKKKVLLAASLMTPAHLYIWDEPLNYIDVFSRMQLESLILRNNPTMLLVEHDVKFINTIATHIVRLDQEGSCDRKRV